MSRVVKLPGCMAAGANPVNDALRRLIVPIRHTGRDITRMESDELSTGLRQLHGAPLSGERLFDSRLHMGAAANMSGGVKGGRQGAPLDGGPTTADDRGAARLRRRGVGDSAVKMIPAGSYQAIKHGKLHWGSNGTVDTHLPLIFYHRCDQYISPFFFF